MNKNAVVVAAIMLTSLLVSCATPEPADLIIKNARIYTMDEAKPWASILVIKDQRILAVGDEALLEGFMGPTRDLNGAMVLPGFHDAHTHLAYGGRQLMQCDLHGIDTIVAIQEKLSACDASLEPEDWLLGGGWNLSLFDEANPHRALLDQVNPERAMLLVGEDGHSSWASTRALDLAGISEETPNPSDGVIERDESGRPSGTLREKAQALVQRFAPAMLFEDAEEGARRAIRMATSVGITSAIDAATTDEDLAVYRSLERAGELPVRMVLAIAMNDPGLGLGARSAIDLATRGDVNALRTDSAKIFVDGVLEGETAALLEPYDSHSGGHGHLNLSHDELTDLVSSLHAQDVQILFHAIGDLAVREALDSVESAIETHGQRDARHHISHIQLVDEADRARFAELGVSANMQALWAMPDPYITQVNLPVVGQHRVDAMYPFGSLVTQGARLAAGSDWSVSSMNPFMAIETAVTRSDADAVYPGVLNADEAVSLHQAIAAYTLEGAYLMHQEADLGALKEGMLADLVVIDRNLFEIPPASIGDTQVLLTLLGGEVVYEHTVPVSSDEKEQEQEQENDPTSVEEGS